MRASLHLLPRRVRIVGAQERIRIAPSSPGLASWPIQLAAKEGFFAREGLSVEIIVMRTNTGVAALVTGSIDFTTAGGSAMRAAVNGAPLKMVLNITKKADLWIVAQKNIQRVEDLRGKIIGVGGNWGTQFYQVLEALKPAGIDKDVQLVSTGDVANGFLSLQQGSMAAVALTPPYNILAKHQGYRDLVKVGDVISVSPTTGLVTTKDKLEKEPQKIRRTIRARDAGGGFCQDVAGRKPFAVHRESIQDGVRKFRNRFTKRSWIRSIRRSGSPIRGADRDQPHRRTDQNED